MDHIGFGLSDQASHEMLCIDHAENLVQLIRELDLQNVTLIVHDWGGPIGIGAFLQEPERVSNLVLLNTTVFPIPKTGMTFHNYPISWLGWCYTPYIIPDNFWGAFAAYAIFTNPKKPISLLSNMVKNIVSMELGVYQGNNIEAQRVFRDQFQSKMNVKSSKRLVLQTKDWGHGNIYYDKILGKRSTQDFYRIIQEEIKDAWGPNGSNVGIKAIIGRWDPLGQNQVLSQWMSALPQLRKNIQTYNNIGHFIEERKPKEIANSIIRLNRL
jgi:pimeloyl-ACP methyl ester carboxylesterase